MKNEKSFPAKILLFGEYSIILNGKGVAIPYPLFEGKLTFARALKTQSNSYESNTELKSFLDYIKNLKKNNLLPVEFDDTSMEFDIDQGLYFDSSIPQGFGVGSSGALVAAVYARYAIKQKRVSDILNNLIELKNNLAKFESHFHGESSGLDPLISYINRPLMIKSKSEIVTVSIPKENKTGKGAIFLLSTNRPHKTEHLVNLFLEKCLNSEFKKMCQEELSLINNEAIDLFMENKSSQLVSCVKKLSLFQYQHFLPMIPKLFQEIWLEGLKTNQYYLKLCGAGGGGFILGFTLDFELTRNLIPNHHLRIVYKI